MMRFAPLTASYAITNFIATSKRVTYRFNLKRSVGQREACYSRCSVIHPVGDHNHRSYFL
ncbi:MAG: hypothetical protein P8179_08490 [Candidatus Thiodiazotropha sp.]